MADNNGRNGFRDFNPDDIFADFSSNRKKEDNSEKISFDAGSDLSSNSFEKPIRADIGRPKFTVHIDDAPDDTLDYNFSSFLDPAERAEEEKRREESMRSFRSFDEEIEAYKKNEQINTASPASRQRSAVPYSTPVRRGGVHENAPDQQKESFVSARPEGAAEAEALRKRPEIHQRPEQAKPPVKEKKKSESKPSKKKPENAAPPSPENVRRRKFGALTGLIGFICIVVAFTAIMTNIGLSAIGDIVAYNRGNTSISVSIEEEKNGNSPTLEHVIGELHEAGLIEQKQLCILFAKFRHFDGYKNSENVWVPTEYISGVYYLEPSLGLEGMLNTIKKSTNLGADTVSLTFPEGWTISQIFERLERNGVCEASKLYANLSAVANQYEFSKEIKASGARYLGYEGYLFPDTYDFYKNENAVSVLQKLYNNSNSKWTKEYQKQANKLGMSRDDILIIASIIQREAANSSQMGDVSSVLHNRLKSATYASLQCNSTTDYVTNSVKDHVTAAEYEVYSNSYNTYRVEGLPPGPICNPGKDAIEAALYPNSTNYYFFAHNNQGKIYLATNFDEFQQACIQVAKDNA